jgi:hypothetical protein
MDKYLNKEKDKDKQLDERIKIINIILDMYPDMKKDKQDIINAVYGKLSKPNTYVFTKIFINNKEYYVDPEGTILTKTLEFKGIILNNKFYMVEDEDDEKFNK